MVKTLGPRAVSVSIQELGMNCWLPRRFIEGKRCCRVMWCKHPKRDTCKAVDAEIAWLHEQRRAQEKVYHEKLSHLLACKKVMQRQMPLKRLV